MARGEREPICCCQRKKQIASHRPQTITALSQNTDAVDVFVRVSGSAHEGATIDNHNDWKPDVHHGA